MSGDWRHTPAGTAAYVGIVIAAGGVAIATDAHFSPVVRTLSVLAALTVCCRGDHLVVAGASKSRPPSDAASQPNARRLTAGWTRSLRGVRRILPS
jgi:hypothetical protein